MCTHTLSHFRQPAGNRPPSLATSRPEVLVSQPTSRRRMAATRCHVISASCCRVSAVVRSGKPQIPEASEDAEIVRLLVTDMGEDATTALVVTAVQGKALCFVCFLAVKLSELEYNSYRSSPSSFLGFPPVLSPSTQPTSPFCCITIAPKPSGLVY